MPNWVRDSGGRLVKRDTPHNKELELSLKIMEATPEDQHSHHGHQDNPNAFRSMRDRMHPPRMSAPSCIVPPTEQLVIRPHIVPLLPTFHGMESENPYAHIKEFEEVCNTFQEGGASIDLMRLKLFPFTLKDKAKIWLNSLRPRSIRTWTDLQAEFLKKFFPTHRTNGLKRQIQTSQLKRMRNSMSVGKDTWKPLMLVLTMVLIHGYCFKRMDEPNKGEVGKMKSQLNASNTKAGMYTLNEDVDMKAKFAAMTRRLEELELKKMHEVQAVAETPVQIQQPCPICQSYEHWWRVPYNSSCKGDVWGSSKCYWTIQAQYQCSVWKHLQLKLEESSNFSWKPRAPQYQQLAQPSQQASSLEQAIGISARLWEILLETKKPSMLNSVRDVKALITLRSGKKVEFQHPSHMLKKKKKRDKEEGGNQRKEGYQGLNVKKAFLTEQVSAIIQCKSPLKYKDPGCPTISVMIGGKVVEKALLDLGASVNLLPYSVYKQLGLGELKPTSITLSLADRSVKIPRGIIEDVLVQVDNFYYPVDFVVLDTDHCQGS
ncbi:hypothetical protein CK203_064346 [Vitis vinifera]|uniref:Retrotransposon gag domain-containing protein n=1 Tax=Vitis vinifera TaxID=29760 RepID=A0A438GWE5_VITVI|nr:hypothetical protein CK203_064346 [Vitis vinifera]